MSSDQSEDPAGLELVPIHWTLRPREDVLDEIVSRFEDGEPLATICRDPFLPARKTLYRWMEDDPEVLTRFARARGRWKLSLADDVIAIADAANLVSLDVDKLRIWARLQLLSRAEAAARRIERRNGKPGDDGTTFESGSTAQKPTQYRIAVIGVEPHRPKPAPEPIEGEFTEGEDDADA